MRLFIHIGYPKTGSTAIQTAIFANQGWLRERGVFVPQSGYGSGLGHAFLLARTQHASSDLSPEKREMVQGRLDALRAELDDAQANGYTTALLSWEGFSLAREPQISMLGTALAQHEVIVLAYVRDQSSLYQSLVLQGLKSLNNLESKKLFEDNAFGSKAIANNYDFTKGLSRWRDGFAGSLDIRVRLYDRSRFSDGDVVVDFLGCLGLEANYEFSMQDKDSNASIDYRGAALLLVASEAGANDSTMHALINALLRIGDEAVDGPQHFLSQSEVARMRALFQESNRQLFVQFRPENATAQEKELEIPSAPAREAVSTQVFEYLHQVHSAFGVPAAVTWGGGLLMWRNLSKLTCSGGKGWCEPSNTGVWSSGSESRLDFLVPRTSPTRGPAEIELTITGGYAGDNQSTEITLNSVTQRLDLTNAVIRAPLSRNSKARTVALSLRHDKPLHFADENEPASSEGRTYRLGSLSYKFLWDS